MSGWAAKRFWTRAEAAPCDGGFTVLLDGRAVKTPAKRPFALPGMDMAQACAAEWDAQKVKIRPDSMPMTRYANSAIDKVAHQHGAVAGIVTAYGETDLLCYRAPGPAGLIDRQTQGWDPVLHWAAQELGASLRVTTGISPIPQEPAHLTLLADSVAALDAFRLTAFHDLVAITGSLILGFAMAKARLTADQGFDLSRIDEHWQAELWGQDEDAARIESGKRADLSAALEFFRYCG